MITAGPSPASYAEVFARIASSSDSRSSSSAASHSMPVVADFHASNSRSRVPQPLHNFPQHSAVSNACHSPAKQTLVAAARSLSVLEPVQLADPMPRPDFSSLQNGGFSPTSDFSTASVTASPRKNSKPAISLTRAPPVAKKPAVFAKPASPEPTKPAKPSRLISFDSDSPTENVMAATFSRDVSPSASVSQPKATSDPLDSIDDETDQPAADTPDALLARVPTPVIDPPPVSKSPESAGSESPILSPRATVRERKANLDARARKRERKAKRNSRPLSGVEEVVLQDRLELFTDESEVPDSSGPRPDRDQTIPSPQPRSIKPASHNTSAPPGGNK